MTSGRRWRRSRTSWGIWSSGWGRTRSSRRRRKAASRVTERLAVGAYRRRVIGPPFPVRRGRGVWAPIRAIERVSEDRIDSREMSRAAPDGNDLTGYLPDGVAALSIHQHTRLGSGGGQSQEA